MKLDTFKLTKDQVKKYKAWRKDREGEYVGAIGGAESWTFHITSIGIACMVSLRTEQGLETLDLTDYDSW